MDLREALIAELDQEMAGTRRMLERVPEAQWSWKPHAKSMTLGRLATHLAELPGWIARILEGDGFDVAAGAPRPPAPESRAALLQYFDANVNAIRSRIAAQSDEDFRRPWSLRQGRETIFTMPRAGILRTLLLNHMIHHRGQFSVYLRMHGVPLPGVYGPTADD